MSTGNAKETRLSVVKSRLPCRYRYDSPTAVV